jgi:hypothetical protein
MASSSVVSELIWHFAGYLRTQPHDNFTIKVIYEGGADAPVGPNLDDPDAHPHHLPAIGMIGAKLDLPILPVFPAPPLIHQSPPHGLHDPVHHYQQPYIGVHPLPPLPAGPAGGGGGGGGGGGSNFTITVSYQGGGDQELVDVRQVNVLIDNNNIDGPPAIVALNKEQADKILGKMVQEAQKHVPADLDLSHSNTTDALKAFVDARDSHPLTTLANDAPFAAQLGQHVNGALVTDGSNPHQITNDLFKDVSQAVKIGFEGLAGLPKLHGDHQADSIQTVSVGSNIQANDAYLSNYEGLTTSLAVHGNFYHTEAIVQVNVFASLNNFSGGPGAMSNLPNTVQNIAEMKNDVPTLTSGGSGTAPSGLHWTVDVCHGDLLDIHSLVQTNYMENNNVIYQTSSYGESQIIAGSNSQTNFAQFQNLTAKYQLIIVEGNYHQDDLIYQTNVLLDGSHINFNGQGLASQSANCGGNTVVNDATIIDTGNHNYQQFNSDAMAVLQALEGQSNTLDPLSLLKAFPALFGDINVLVVTGSFYDVNYISQTNIMSNYNVVQFNGSSTAPAGATQTVNTGHDITVNSATIVNGGSALSPYLQGNYYNDMILIQTNIIGTDPKIAVQDPSHLAPELIAFAGGVEAASTGPDVTIAASATTQHHDGVASVLH